MKIGVISDTHGCAAETRSALDIFREQGVSAVIHCGDIGNTAVIEVFRGMETHFVFGNCDGTNEGMCAAVQSTGNRMYGWFGSIEREGKKIAFLHGHQTERFDKEIRSGVWDLICSGHTHIPALQMSGKTLLLNPGAFQRVVFPTVAIVTLPEMRVERFQID